MTVAVLRSCVLGPCVLGWCVLCSCVLGSGVPCCGPSPVVPRRAALRCAVPAPAAEAGGRSAHHRGGAGLQHRLGPRRLLAYVSRPCRHRDRWEHVCVHACVRAGVYRVGCQGWACMCEGCGCVCACACAYECAGTGSLWGKGRVGVGLGGATPRHVGARTLSAGCQGHSVSVSPIPLCPAGMFIYRFFGTARWARWADGM